MFSVNGFKSIYLFENLEVLNISVRKINNIAFTNLINEQPNLKKLYLIDCTNLNYDTLKEINDLKLNRGDENVLKIYSKLNVDYVNLDRLPLLSLVNSRENSKCNFYNCMTMYDADELL